MFLVFLGVAAIVAALSAMPCLAQTPAPQHSAAGWYIGGEAGWTDLGKEEGALPPKVFPEAWHNGFAVGARVGYRLGPVRLEQEFRYGENELSRIGLHPSQGSRAAYAIMSNVLYDFDLGGPVSPHLGAGIGAVALHDDARVAVLGISSVDDDTDWVLGYQAIAGLSYAINPSVSAELDYRYLATATPQFTTSPGLVVDGVPTGSQRFSSGYAIHTILASVIWHWDTVP